MSLSFVQELFDGPVDQRPGWIHVEHKEILVDQVICPAQDTQGMEATNFGTQEKVKVTESVSRFIVNMETGAEWPYKQDDILMVKGGKGTAGPRVQNLFTKKGAEAAKKRRKLGKK